MSNTLAVETAIAVRDTCLCLATQRAARVLARRFDNAFRALGITNNQFSLMMMLSGPKPPLLTWLGPALAMDRTTVTAALKALEKRGLVIVRGDADDGRAKRPQLTPEGRHLLAAALPIWRSEHATLEAGMPDVDADLLRRQLMIVSTPTKE